MDDTKSFESTQEVCRDVVLEVPPYNRCIHEKRSHQDRSCLSLHPQSMRQNTQTICSRLILTRFETLTGPCRFLRPIDLHGLIERVVKRFRGALCVVIGSARLQQSRDSAGS